MNLKKLFGLGNKTKQAQESTDALDNDSVSLVYSEQNNTFEQDSELSDKNGLYKKTTSDNESFNEENKTELYEIEESSKFDQTQKFESEKKPMFSFSKEDSVSEGNSVINEAPEVGDLVTPAKKSFFSFGKKKSSEDEFDRPSVAKDVSNLIKANKEGTEPRSRSSLSDVSESSFETKQKKIPLLSSLPVKRQYQTIGALTVISSLVLGFGFFSYATGAKEQSSAEQIITQAKADLQKFDNSFSSATIGKFGAYDKMLEDHKRIKDDFAKIKETSKNFSRSEDNKFSPIEKQMDESFKIIDKNVDKVKSQSDFLKNTSQRVNQISEDANSITDQADRLAMVYLQLGATQNELSNIYFMRGLLQTINSGASNLLLSDASNTETSINLVKARQTFKKSLAELYYGDETKNINPISFGTPFNTYSKLATKWIQFADKVDAVSKGASGLLTVRALAPETSKLVLSLDKNIDDALNVYSLDGFYQINNAKKLLILGGVLLFISVILLIVIYTYEKANKALLEKIENNKNQSSILRLLNEMIPLQDGDLTAHATVSDEITGAIADSINATVDSLGSLVRKIKDNSLTMREKTNEVNLISISMLKSNEEQSGSIQGAATSIKEIATAIRDISDKTKKGVLQAATSVKASQEGAQQVFSSVESMQSIDVTMIETDKLMGKVQESSRQISEIVELLSDITEGTSILALNATVQAAKAGEAGKGFKIVADKIQDLADNAADATRRVGVLIATVQTDIQAVGESVGKAKMEVKNGVSLSQSAGESLSKITEVSNRLSEMVAEISQEAIGYAKSSDEVSKNMESLMVSTQANKISTQKTASSISEIAGMSNELGESVQSFKVE